MGDRINFDGFYRGTCVDNFDPDVRGRLKIHIPGVYAEELSIVPENLPWAEPVMPLFGGSWTNERGGDLNAETGVTTIPHTSSTALNGAQLWVFFERGDQNYPKYFGACQAAAGWHSEHNNQHVIKTDNVRIRVDENPDVPESTCKFDSYNEEVGEEINFSKKKAFKQKPTRVDIQIKATNKVAINLQIEGDVNLNTVGNIYERHEGVRHQTHIGNLYRYHDGDEYIVHKGDLTYEKTGNSEIKHKGNIHATVLGELVRTITKAFKSIVFGDSGYSTKGSCSENIDKDKNTSVGQGCNIKAGGNVQFETPGNTTISTSNYKVDAKNDIYHISQQGTIIRQAHGEGPYIEKENDYAHPELMVRGGIIDKGNFIRRSGKGAMLGIHIDPRTGTPMPTPEIKAIKDIVPGNPLEGSIHHTADPTSAILMNPEYD